MKALYALGAALLLSGLATAQSPWGRGLEVSDSAGTKVGTACQSVTSCAIPQIFPVGATNIHIHGGVGRPYVFLGSVAGPVSCPIIMPNLGLNLLNGPFVIKTGVLNLATMTPCPGHANFQIPATPMTLYVQAFVGTPSGANGWTDRVRIR